MTRSVADADAGAPAAVSTASTTPSVAAATLLVRLAKEPETDSTTIPPNRVNKMPPAAYFPPRTPNSTTIRTLSLHARQTGEPITSRTVEPHSRKKYRHITLARIAVKHKIISRKTRLDQGGN
ncbi:hypothetical protein [Streptosporangium sp. NPDC000396]|uniref:hypothetical protein n=1 Tax=Streptosporangium sp. NPDC000396 TaxID=3366185 RepID=UPI003690A951